MDLSPVSRDLREITKVAAEKWRTEAERRSDLRKELKPHVSDARKALRAARKVDPEGKTAAFHRAERQLRKAKSAVPDTLPVLATKVVVGTAVVARVIGPSLVDAVPAEVWPWVALMAAGGAVGGLVWLVRRWWPTGEAGGLVPTEEERRLLSRLAPEFWAAHREARGLAGTITGVPVLTDAGIECAVRLDGQWSAKKLRAADDAVRALLGARTDLPMLIGPGTKGGWGVIRLRTRSAAPDGAIVWRPGDAFGVDMVTGEDVRVPLGHRMLIAGMSGAGKSTASRPLLFEASEGPANVLVIIDLKMVEGRLWDHRARVAYEPGAVIELVGELVAELMERLAVLPKGQATLIPTVERPRITVVVDEGAEVVASAKDALEGLDTIARMGRAACVDLWWMTQSPTYGDGVPRQIAKQLGYRIGLAVESPSEARVVFGESAQEKGWKADELPMPGVAMVRDGKRTPDPVKVRYMDDQAVIGLSDQRIWRRGAAVASSRPVLSLVKDDVLSAPRKESGLSGHDGAILAFVQAAEGPVRQKAIGEELGIAKGSVSKAVKRLVDAGHLVRAEDGALFVTNASSAEEATA